MGLLDFLRYGFQPDVADFLYRQIPVYLLLAGGIFILIYLLLSLAGITPAGPLAIAVLLFSFSVAFLLLTRSFGWWFVRNIGAVFLMSQGLSFGVIIVFVGLVLYLIFAK